MIDYGFKVCLDGLFDRDKDQFLLWRNDLRIRRYCRQNDLISEAHHTKWWEKVRTSETEKMYSVIRRSDCELIGMTGLTSLDLINHRAEFSLYIAPKFQGAGLGKEALMTLVSHGFAAYGLQTIWGETFSFNKADKMFEEVGFTKEGTRRDFYFREGNFIDAHLYSITVKDWLESSLFTAHRKEICLS